MCGACHRDTWSALHIMALASTCEEQDRTCAWKLRSNVSAASFGQAPLKVRPCRAAAPGTWGA
eukprot:4819470-Lingulodinium_polyedra.AAC.1